MSRWLHAAGASVALAAALALNPAPLAAQLEIGPTLGVFWPIGGWSHDDASGNVERRQLAATLLGARVALWTSRRLGLEATVGYAPSQVAVSTVDRTQDITSGVVLGSLRALAHLFTLNDVRPGAYRTSWAFYGGAGVGFVARGGSAWENHTGTTYPTAVLNFETRTHLVGPVNLRVMLEDYVAAPTFNEGQPGETRSRVHHDLILTFMAVVRMGRSQ